MRTSIVVFFATIAFGWQPLLAAEKLVDESRVLGHQQCMDCHDLPYEAWMRSGHANRSLAMLSTNVRALRFARRLNIKPDELAGDSVCTDCHGTRRRTHAGGVQVNHGVSCESCHGPAGASNSTLGWYELHSEEKSGGFDDEDHHSALKEAGLAGVDDLYSVAVRCYECHSISNEQVVGAGHMAGSPGFELATWFSGEVRHNFAPETVVTDDAEVNQLASNLWLAHDQGRNPEARRRLMYVVGLLAELEVNLRNRSKATKAGTFAISAAGQSIAAYTRLKQVAQRIQADELLEAIEATKSVQSLLFLPPEEGHVPTISKAADRVVQAAQEFTVKYDGQQLQAIEALLPQESIGQAFQP